MSADEHFASEMYREHILELYKDPPNFGSLANATHIFRSYNPLCGDDITMQVLVKGDKIQDVKFTGKGCAISIAGAALLTEMLKGKTLQQGRSLAKDDVLNALQIPIGPVRLKCALLGLEALQIALG